MIAPRRNSGLRSRSQQARTPYRSARQNDDAKLANLRAENLSMRDVRGTMNPQPSWNCRRGEGHQPSLIRLQCSHHRPEGTRQRRLSERAAEAGVVRRTPLVGEGGCSEAYVEL